MKLIYVSLPVMVEQRFALVVVNEQDLEHQLAEREAAFRALPFKAKPDRDKKGALVMHQMGKDWDVRCTHDFEIVNRCQQVCRECGFSEEVDA